MIRREDSHSVLYVRDVLHASWSTFCMLFSRKQQNSLAALAMITNTRELKIFLCSRLYASMLSFGSFVCLSVAKIRTQKYDFLKKSNLQFY